MDQLENQVSDLCSFLRGPDVSTPVPSGGGRGPPPLPSAHTHLHASPSSYSAPGDNSAPPPPATNHHHGHQQQAFPFLPPADQVAAKRRADEEEADGHLKQQRSKRNRYISLACNECKRRKIKCNGQTPCQRCGNLNLQCLYTPNCCAASFKDSEEYRELNEKMGWLQDQVNSLIDNMHAFRQETLRLAPIQDRAPTQPPSDTVTPAPSMSSMLSLPRPTLPAPRVSSSFSGPTSIAFTVDMAKNTLHNMGYSAPGDGAEDNTGLSEASPQPPPRSPEQQQQQQKLPVDPLWQFDKDEMVRLCRLHEEEIGIMYPVVKMEEITEHAKNLHRWLDAAKRQGFSTTAQFGGQGGGVADDKTLLLKIVICCALVVEEHGDSARATRLLESMQPIIDRKLMTEPASVANLPLLALVGGYRFLSNDEILAWRVMGQVVRLCMELGLHRREGLAKIADSNDRRMALNSFWVAYMLDRRWAFGTGLPYVCEDDKIDPQLPYPEEYPYLVAMITYSQLAARIWRLVDYFEPAVVRELKRHEYEEMDRVILEWYDTVPEDIKVPSLEREMIPIPTGPAYDLQRLRIWTRLRLNQIRMWLLTPVLHSAISIVENVSLAQTVVELAKDTIQYLTRLNSTTNLYRRLQVFYHQFLTSAIAVLFLASTHAPLRFSANCRAEFYMALELVKDMSARSWVSQRLWRAIRSLKAVAPRLGLGEDPGEAQQQRANSDGPATIPNAHTTPGASHSPVSVMAPFHPDLRRQPGSSSASPSAAPLVPSLHHHDVSFASDGELNGLRLRSEMSRIFEDYMGSTLGGGISISISRVQSPDVPMVAGEVNASVYQQMKNLF